MIQLSRKTSRDIIEMSRSDSVKTKILKLLEQQISDGYGLYGAMLKECGLTSYSDYKRIKDNYTMPTAFSGVYQSWYSVSHRIVAQILPERLDDFVSFYEKPRKTAQIDHENYSIKDYLLGMRVTITNGFGEERIKVGPQAAVPKFVQQLTILESLKPILDDRLLDIRDLVTADIFDSEIEQARYLVSNGFLRSGGAIAGVVLEKHLRQVCKNHNIKPSKKHPTISDYNDLLKSNDVIDVAEWRKIGYLGDLRNKCDHDKKVEPTEENLSDLLDGVDKVLKNLY